MEFVLYLHSIQIIIDRDEVMAEEVALHGLSSLHHLHYRHCKIRKLLLLLVNLVF